MCTVTYLPATDGFILTHNRDEAPTRSPKQLTRQPMEDDTLLFPRDTKAGGTWIATSASGKTACLLNGAFEKHHHQPPYRRSRGLVLLDFLTSAQSDLFLAQIDLEGIEPFTLLYFLPQEVVAFRWDGHQKHTQRLPADQPHFWCSATLYPAPMRARREQVFRDWLAAPPSTPPQPEQILALHRQGSVGDPENDYVMDRAGRVKTVSITQVVSQNAQASLHYFDLLDHTEDSDSLRFVNWLIG